MSPKSTCERDCCNCCWILRSHSNSGFLGWGEKLGATWGRLRSVMNGVEVVPVGPNLKPAKGQQLAPDFGREWSPGTHGIHVCLAHPLGWDEETPSLWSPQLATGHDAGSPGESLKHCFCFGTLVGIQKYRKGYALRDFGDTSCYDLDMLRSSSKVTQK